jgi:hypothetical protein
LHTQAQIHRASLSDSSSYLAPGAGGAAVLAVELLPVMKHIDGLRRQRVAIGPGPAKQEEGGRALDAWAPVFEIDRRKTLAEIEEDVEDIEEF